MFVCTDITGLIQLPFRPESRKFAFHLQEWLTTGEVAGDQGMMAGSIPLLYINSANESEWQAALLIFGNGCMETIVNELHQRESQSVNDIIPATDSSNSISKGMPDESNWRNQDVSFYVSLCTTASSESDAIGINMLRHLVPLRSAPFFFSAIPMRFESALIALNKELGDAARIDWNPTGVVETIDCIRTENPERRHILDECARKYNGATSATAVASAAASSDTACVHPVSNCCASGIYIAPLRLDHVELIVRHWPWSIPSCAPTLISYLIQHYCTRCIYSAEGEPLAWALENRYGSIGMLHTQPEHRGKGYSSLIVESMCSTGAMKLHLPHSPGDDPNKQPDHTIFADITRGNTASERVFAKRGFKKVVDVHWARWTPRI
jgi:GNAT superfamily N-acetyltransferase